MKKIIVVICNLFCAYSFIACSSKVQTNDIPNDKKYFLPSETSNKEVKIDPQILEDFNLALKDFFNYKEKKENEQNIYKTGMRYFND
ncbi:hypothetical protein ABZL51_001622 [Campylobacter jejuni]|uniref:Lipoprotein n=1 Tax=Campylobacter jejuni TaxID=197 RepID=A0AAN3QZI5_CAMJU|nr:MULTISPECIES: hypothetical protein [Campylobacter]EAK3496106.1 hypothetical protein [Campylobacter jejuni]ECL3018565.1 hypothetical protein [Campylobacter jejuni]ECQ7086230.1 hypothetical protein [Campylobacter jejuni]EDP3691003.1 hypothetical protein [Campylobacter jejuni]EDP6004721.1 hypothetical protein [Campylobacter jejuni]